MSDFGGGTTSDSDAEKRFLWSVRTYKAAEDRAKAEGTAKIDAREFQMTMIDIDAAIPGLEGVMLGRALVLKACCLHYLYLAGLADRAWFDVTAPPSPFFHEAYSCAIKGRKVLENSGGESDLPWANSIVKMLGEYGFADDGIDNRPS